MTKIDFKKEYSEFYKASPQQISEVDVLPLQYLMVDGQGDPNNSESYKEAVEALFSVSYKTKFMIKNSGGQDYVVMPLEGLWWADDPSVFLTDDRSKWLWTMMIMQPDFVGQQPVQAAIEAQRQKKDLPGLKRLRLETFEEGHSAQILHTGPFSEEGPTIQKLHAYIQNRGSLRGKHHEIYLSDIRRARPENWKTIIRQPMS